MKRTDENQKRIIDVLRQVGASVFVLSDVGKGVCDLLVGYCGKNYLIEIKNPERCWRLTDYQKEFFEEWKGQKAIATNEKEALNIIGVEY